MTRPSDRWSTPIDNAAAASVAVIDAKTGEVLYVYRQ